MSKQNRQPPKTDAQKDAEWEAEWLADNARITSGEKREKPTAAELKAQQDADRERDIRQKYPAPQFEGTDRHFAGQSAVHRRIQASNRGRNDMEDAKKFQSKLERELNEASAFIAASNATLLSERERWHVHVGLDTKHLDQLLEQIYECETWNDIRAPKPDVSPDHTPADNRLALKTYTMENRRVSEVIRELMKGEDTIRALIQQMCECRDGGLEYMRQLKLNPAKIDIQLPQIEFLHELQSCVDAKLRAWRRFLNKWSDQTHPDIQLTFEDLLTFRQNWREMRKEDIRAKIETDAKLEADRRTAAARPNTYRLAGISPSGVVSVTPRKSPAARGPPPRTHDSPAARGPPRESAPDADALAEDMEKLLTSRRKTLEVRPPKSMRTLLQELKADADIYKTGRLSA